MFLTFVLNVMALSSLYGPEAHYALMLNISDTGFSIGEELYGTQG